MFPQPHPLTAATASYFRRSAASLRQLLPVLFAAFVGSCAQKNEFVQVAPDRPHAVLTVATGTLFATGPIVSSINGQPPSRWRYREEYRLNPGPTTIHVVADRQPFDFGPLEFTAAAGHSYEIRRVFESAGEFAALYEVEKGSPFPQLITRAPRMMDW